MVFFVMWWLLNQRLKWIGRQDAIVKVLFTLGVVKLKINQDKSFQG